MAMPEVEPGERLEGWLGRLLGEEGGLIGLPLNSTSIALEAVRPVKSGAGTLLGFSGLNTGPAQFVLAFDTSQTPLAAGLVPVIVITVGANTNFSYDGGRLGRTFLQGIVLANSTTAATLTAGAANCWFDAQYV